MNSYWVLVRLNENPGAATVKQYVQADNPYNAIQMAKSLYGRLLLSESAMPA